MEPRWKKPCAWCNGIDVAHMDICCPACGTIPRHTVYVFHCEFCDFSCRTYSRHEVAKKAAEHWKTNHNE